MRIEESEVEELKQMLQKYWQLGARWVAYENPQYDLQNRMTGFSDVSMANDYCRIFQSQGQDVKFKSMSTILETIGIHEGKLQRVPVNEGKLIKEIERNQLVPMTVGDDLSKSMQTCEIYPVLQSRLSSYAEEMGSFLVAQQSFLPERLPGTGYGAPQITASFDDYDKAQTYYQHQCESNSSLSYMKRPRLLLLGQYKEKKLQIGEDGFPDSETGLIFSVARSASDSEHPVTAYQVTQVTDPHTLSVKFDSVLAQFDSRENKIHLFDGDLQPVVPGQSLGKIEADRFGFGIAVQIEPGPTQVIRQLEKNTETVNKIQRNRLS